MLCMECFSGPAEEPPRGLFRPFHHPCLQRPIDTDSLSLDLYKTIIVIASFVKHCEEALFIFCVINIRYRFADRRL